MNRYQKSLDKLLLDNFPLVKRQRDLEILRRLKEPPKSSGIIVVEE